MILKTTQKNRVKAFLESEAFGQVIGRVQDLLKDSGVLTFLREKSKPTIVGYSAQDVEAQKNHSLWAAGYNEALDDIIYFRETFLDVFNDKPEEALGRAYTAATLHHAFSKNDLTQEEKDGLQSGKQPKLKSIDISKN